MSFYSPSLIPSPQATMGIPVTHLNMLFFSFLFLKLYFNVLFDFFSLTHELFKTGLFYFHIFENFPEIFMLLISNLILWSENILCMTLFF